jgi:hypothetical protein
MMTKKELRKFYREYVWGNIARWNVPQEARRFVDILDDLKWMGSQCPTPESANTWARAMELVIHSEIRKAGVGDIRGEAGFEFECEMIGYVNRHGQPEPDPEPDPDSFLDPGPF